METKETRCHPKPVVNATCLLGNKGCYENGKCHYMGNCEHKVLTNADRIRAMSDEELAHFLNPMGCPSVSQGNCYEMPCQNCWGKWLKQPAEVEEDA